MPRWVAVTIKMPSDLYDTIDAATAVTQESTAKFIRRAIEERLRKTDDVASSTEAIVDGVTMATETAFARGELRRRMLARRDRWLENADDSE